MLNQSKPPKIAVKNNIVQENAISNRGNEIPETPFLLSII